MLLCQMDEAVSNSLVAAPRTLKAYKLVVMDRREVGEVEMSE